MNEQLYLSTFEPLIGQRFTATLPTNETFAFELESAAALQEHSSNGSYVEGRVPFSLVLLGPPGFSIPQGTYHFAHDTVGEFDMFVVPVERRGDRLLYQAIFN